MVANAPTEYAVEDNVLDQLNGIVTQFTKAIAQQSGITAIEKLQFLGTAAGIANAIAVNRGSRAHDTNMRELQLRGMPYIQSVDFNAVPNLDGVATNE